MEKNTRMQGTLCCMISRTENSSSNATFTYSVWFSVMTFKVHFWMENVFPVKSASSFYIILIFGAQALSRNDWILYVSALLCRISCLFLNNKWNSRCQHVCTYTSYSFTSFLHTSPKRHRRRRRRSNFHIDWNLSYFLFSPLTDWLTEWVSDWDEHVLFSVSGILWFLRFPLHSSSSFFFFLVWLKLAKSHRFAVISVGMCVCVFSKASSCGCVCIVWYYKPLAHNTYRYRYIYM